MTGESLISALKRKFRVTTDRDLADSIGNSVPGIQVWKNRETVTERQVAELVYKASQSGVMAAQVNAIRPLVEFFPITKAGSKQGASYLLFPTSDGTRGNRYLEGLRQELEANRGVYIFFDSRGQAIYTGKARKQCLWKEMNLAYNRDRGEIQKIKKVRHPKRNQAYRNTNEKSRQIIDHNRPYCPFARTCRLLQRVRSGGRHDFGVGSDAG